MARLDFLHMFTGLLQSRLVFVTGKGGVGKTSFSGALGLSNASTGKKTLLVEVDNFHSSLRAIFNVEPRYKPTKINDNLYCCNITWKKALEDWLYQTIPIRRVSKMILNNQVAMLFLDATPGARELVILSKIIELTKKWDQVIVDLPASGHALGILRVPITAMKMMKTGPIHQRAAKMISVFRSEKTRIVLVTLPEEMVINEAIEFWQKIDEEIPLFHKPIILLNRVSFPSFSDAEKVLLQRVEKREISDFGRELIRAGRWDEDLEEGTSKAVKRLEEFLNTSVFCFPRFGLLGGFKGGPTKLVNQLHSAIVRAVLKESSK